MPLTHRIAPFLPSALVEAIETVSGAAQRGYRKLPRPWRQQVEALLDWAVESGALHAAVVVLLTVIILDVLLRAANQRPAAYGNESRPAPPPADQAQGAALPPRPTGNIAPLCFPHRPCLPRILGSARAAQPATRRPARRAGRAGPPAAQGRQSRRRRRAHGARRGNIKKRRVRGGLCGLCESVCRAGGAP